MSARDVSARPRPVRAAAARREHRLRLRPRRRRARAAHARPAARGGDRRARQADDRVPRPEDGARRRARLPRPPVRRDPRRGRVGRGARGAAHPRGAAHVWRRRPREVPRPRRVVAARDRAAAAARGEHDHGATSGPRRCTRCPPSCARRSTRRSRTAARRSSTRSASAAASTTCAGDQFIDMYVNELTLDYGDEGRQAVRELLARAQRGASEVRMGRREPRGRPRRRAHARSAATAARSPACAPTTSRRLAIARGGGACRRRARRDRGRLVRLREPGGRGQPQRRADGGAPRRPARVRRRRDRQPPVRLRTLRRRRRVPRGRPPATATCSSRAASSR